jgi:hypothetical protein
MRSFFLSSAIKRLILSMAFPVALVAAYCLLLTVISTNDISREIKDARENWTREFEKFNEWTTSGEGARCEQLFSDAAPYITPSSCTRPASHDSKTKFTEYAKCEETHLRQQHASVSRFLDSGCPITNDPRHLPYGEGRVLNLFEMLDFERRTNWDLGLASPRNPDPFVADDWDWNDVYSRVVERLPRGLAIIVGMFVGGLFFLSCIIRELILETHLGWRRLTIVASIFGAISVPVIYLDDMRDPLSLTIFVAVAALIGSAAMIIYGRKIFLWIYSGFTPASPSAVTSQETVSSAQESQNILDDVGARPNNVTKTQTDGSIKTFTIDEKRVVLPVWQVPLSPLEALAKGVRLAFYLILIALVVDFARSMITGDRPVHVMTMAILLFASAQPPYFAQTLRVTQKAIAFFIGLVVGWVCQLLVAVFAVVALMPMIGLMTIAPSTAPVIGMIGLLVPFLLAYAASKAVVRKLTKSNTSFSG